MGRMVVMRNKKKLKQQKRRKGVQLACGRVLKQLWFPKLNMSCSRFLDKKLAFVGCLEQCCRLHVLNWCSSSCPTEALALENFIISYILYYGIIDYLPLSKYHYCAV
uniref:Uncharacterized protein n=1 Tax=Arundo donax TaxID=35708 RepID=A0A0A9CV47_ARUDO